MITLKHAAKSIYTAWDTVQSSIITNCFHHVGVSIPFIEEKSSEAEELILIESANLLSIDNPEIVNENIQVYMKILKLKIGKL